MTEFQFVTLRQAFNGNPVSVNTRLVILVTELPVAHPERPDGDLSDNFCVIVFVGGDSCPVRENRIRVTNLLAGID